MFVYFYIQQANFLCVLIFYVFCERIFYNSQDLQWLGLLIKKGGSEMRILFVFLTVFFSVLGQVAPSGAGDIKIRSDFGQLVLNLSDTVLVVNIKDGIGTINETVVPFFSDLEFVGFMTHK